LEFFNTETSPLVSKSLSLNLSPDFIQLMLFLMNFNLCFLDLPQHVRIMQLELSTLLSKLFIFFQDPFILFFNSKVLCLNPRIAFPNSF
jgi:hypothetical protein